MGSMERNWEICAPGVDLYGASTPLMLDTRSPGEYAAGHIPGAVSFPLFDDEERALVGTLYKERGKDRAVEEGLALVAPKMQRWVREARALQEAHGAAGELLVYCWRGGMRSGSMAWLLSTAGLPVQQLEGGYKAYRRWVLEGLGQLRDYRVLGGMTGVGKTQLLEAIEAAGGQTLPLEQLAGHLGSAFGNLDRRPQPTSEQFANLCHRVLSGFADDQPVWMENESRTIGKVHLPEELFHRLVAAPLWVIERSREERLDHIFAIYGGADPAQLVAAFERIRPKLGGAATEEAVAAIAAGDLRRAADLGLTYYDALYAHSRRKRPRPVAGTLDWTGRTPEAAAEHLLTFPFLGPSL
jgi:tRNA 2-selenouridine synthase